MPDSTFWLVLAVLGITIALSVVQGRAKDQLGRVERKLDAMLKHAQIDVTVIAGREAAEQVRAGNKIQAIRIYRELTGVGLAEAKERVERLGHAGDRGGAPSP